MLRVGCIKYINTLPLFGALLEGYIPLSNIEITLGTPTELNWLLFQGALDLSLISSFEYLKNNAYYNQVSTFGIAAKEAVQSVLLYHKGNVHDLNHTTIGLTVESATSVALLQLLCKHYWKCSPHFEYLDKSSSILNYDAFLLIGDQALTTFVPPEYAVTDLATEWLNFTSYPMAFGVLAAKKDTPQDALAEFSSLMDQSLNWGLLHQDVIISLALKKLLLPKKRISDYFQLLNYKFKEKELLSLKRFASYVR